GFDAIFRQRIKPSFQSGQAYDGFENRTREIAALCGAIGFGAPLRIVSALALAGRKALDRVVGVIGGNGSHSENIAGMHVHYDRGCHWRWAVLLQGALRRLLYI